MVEDFRFFVAPLKNVMNKSMHIMAKGTVNTNNSMGQWKKRFNSKIGIIVDKIMPNTEIFRNVPALLMFLLCVIPNVPTPMR